MIDCKKDCPHAKTNPGYEPSNTMNTPTYMRDCIKCKENQLCTAEAEIEELKIDADCYDARIIILKSEIENLNKDYMDAEDKIAMHTVVEGEIEIRVKASDNLQPSTSGYFKAIKSDPYESGKQAEREKILEWMEITGFSKIEWKVHAAIKSGEHWSEPETFSPLPEGETRGENEQG